MALFAVVGVMSESREFEKAGKPPLLPQSQDPEKKLKELRPLNDAKSAIWLHLLMVEAKLMSKKVVKCGHCPRGAVADRIDQHVPKHILTEPV